MYGSSQLTHYHYTLMATGVPMFSAFRTPVIRISLFSGAETRPAALQIVHIGPLYFNTVHRGESRSRRVLHPLSNYPPPITPGATARRKMRIILYCIVDRRRDDPWSAVHVLQ